jgi:hypothetical protein
MFRHNKECCHQILGITSLWLIVPVYIGYYEIDCFRCVILLTTTISSIIYWGYDCCLEVDMMMARVTALTHLLYSLYLPPPFPFFGIFGTTMVSLLYKISENASKTNAPYNKKLLYHLLFRYVGFWVVFILTCYNIINTLLEWFMIISLTSILYFGYVYMEYKTFDIKIRYETRLLTMAFIILYACVAIPL